MLEGLSPDGLEMAKGLFKGRSLNWNCSTRVCQCVEVCDSAAGCHSIGCMSGLTCMSALVYYLLFWAYGQIVREYIAGCNAKAV